jgi:hypothetical protein
MDSIIKLTILFNEPFWVGIFEAMDGYELKVCKVTFGAEPRDQEIHEFILMNFYRLNFSGSVEIEKNELTPKKQNPKRLQRAIRKETDIRGVGTKAQIAMKLQHDQLKLQRKKKTKEQRIQEEERKFNIKQRRKLDKHKGH